MDVQNFKFVPKMFPKWGTFSPKFCPFDNSFHRLKLGGGRRHDATVCVYFTVKLIAFFL